MMDAILTNALTDKNAPQLSHLIDSDRKSKKLYSERDVTFVYNYNKKII